MLTAMGTVKRHRAIIGGEEYGQDRLISCKTSRTLFSESALAMGGCCAGQISLSLREAGNIPRMAEIKVYTQLVNGEQTSEWLPVGIYYLDTRKLDKASGVLTITGYDAMLKTEQVYMREGDMGQWPRTMEEIVRDICGRIGVDVDSRTVLNPAYTIDYPNDYTMREILGYIAAAHGGNWTITPTGRLRLVTLPEQSSETTVHIGLNAASFDGGDPLEPISRVTVWYDDEHAFTAGDDTGRGLELDCPWATQAMVDDLLSSLSGYVYRPFTAGDALLDPAAELGDGVSIAGIYSVLAQISTIHDALDAADIGAPGEAELDHEYPYISGQQRALKRKVTLGASYYGTSISRKEGLVIRKTDGETVSAQAMLNADRLTFQALKNGRLQDCIYFDAAAGKYRLTGDVLIDGALSTESLYASYGDVANLAVNRLTTSRRIVKYLAKDTTDDNYVAIQDQQIQLVAGVYAGGTEQARDPDGALLYWEEDPTDAAIGSDGYPYIDGIRIFTTTTETQWPVMVYTYTDQVKRSISFEQIGEFYTPVDTFGVGDQAGNRIGQLIKNDAGLTLSYKAADGSEIALTFLDDGYTDLTGLRKITSIDFSSLAGGTFAVTLEGISESYQFGVNYGANGLPSEIIYPGGASCAITWG